MGPSPSPFFRFLDGGRVEVGGGGFASGAGECEGSDEGGEIDVMSKDGER